LVSFNKKRRNKNYTFLEGGFEKPLLGLKKQAKLIITLPCPKDKVL